MYTFYQRIDSDQKETGMNDIQDEQMLALWQHEWNAIGFDTQVLTVQHAQQHASYKDYYRQLQQIPLEGKSKKNRMYNEYCYLRWLAMSVVGGGWMSDYDVFPLSFPTEKKIPNNPFSLPNKELPNNGQLTIYSRTESGGGIPCLVSGYAKEWDRVAMEMLQNAKSHENDENLVLWSDMFALMDMQKQNAAVYMSTNNVIPGQFVLNGIEVTQKDCHEHRERIAIHFSHSSLRLGNLDNILTNDATTTNNNSNHNHPSNRPFVAKRWLTMWKHECTT